ncbi:hypothetical protein [Streptomyces gibsoniae]|uniref:hypothetical protein n=1 Tax=Streptomyces gibsoniae TaxID=3075529 RepID=UPI00288C22D6|nr:hypothetical protein [Streptomyces sp. DSM 41699]
MKTKISRATVLVLAVAMSGTLIGGSVGTAFAASKVTQVTAEAQPGRTALTPVPSAEYAPSSSPLHALNGYVSYSQDGYRIDAPASVLADIPQADLEKLNAYIGAVNSDIKSGKLVMSAEGVAETASSEAPARQTLAVAQKAASKRHGYIKTHWYGVEVGLDSWLTNKVEGGTWVASGAGGLATLMGGGTTAGIVAAALATAAGAIQVCQHKDGWTILYWVGPIGAGGFVCNPFG